MASLFASLPPEVASLICTHVVSCDSPLAVARLHHAFGCAAAPRAALLSAKDDLTQLCSGTCFASELHSAVNGTSSCSEWARTIEHYSNCLARAKIDEEVLASIALRQHNHLFWDSNSDSDSSWGSRWSLPEWTESICGESQFEWSSSDSESESDIVGGSTTADSISDGDGESYTDDDSESEGERDSDSDSLSDSDGDSDGDSDRVVRVSISDSSSSSVCVRGGDRDSGSGNGIVSESSYSGNGEVGHSPLIHASVYEGCTAFGGRAASAEYSVDELLERLEAFDIGSAESSNSRSNFESCWDTSIQRLEEDMLGEGLGALSEAESVFYSASEDCTLHVDGVTLGESDLSDSEVVIHVDDFASDLNVGCEDYCSGQSARPSDGGDFDSSSVPSCLWNGSDHACSDRESLSGDSFCDAFEDSVGDALSLSDSECLWDD